MGASTIIMVTPGQPYRIRRGRSCTGYGALMQITCLQSETMAQYCFGTVLNGGVVGAWGGAALYVVFLGTAMFLRLKTDRWKLIDLGEARVPHPVDPTGERPPHSS